MRPTARLACALVLVAAPALAETLVTAPEFEAMSTGSTLFFNQGGNAYGAEQYLPDRRVIWQYADGSCANGIWFERGDSLCFAYENDPTPQCWLFSRRDDGFFARVAGLAAGDPSELSLAGQSDTPLKCSGPDLGV